MTQTLLVNSGEFEFTRFDRAVTVLQNEYGYEGLAWEMVVASHDLEVLSEFLASDGLDVQLETL